MKNLDSAVAHCNRVLSDRSFGRIPTPLEVLGTANVRAAIYLLQQARSNFALSDTFLGQQLGAGGCRQVQDHEATETAYKQTKEGNAK